MKLSVSRRNQLFQEIDLGKDVLSQDYSETIFLIGRSKDCHIVLDDNKISREHARIIHKHGHWFVEKVNPENACQINGENFNRHELKNNDYLVVEDFSISFYLNTSESSEDSQIIKVDKVRKISTTPDVEVAPIELDTNYLENSDLNFSSEDENENVVESGIDHNATNEIVLDNAQVAPIEEIANRYEYEEAPVEDFSLDNSNEKESITDQSTDAAFAIGNEIEPFADNAYSLENIDNEMEDESTKVIQSFATVHLELFGDTAPYDRFIIEKDKTFIGRDPSKCQIILNDSEVSTVHAVITKNNIMLTLEDLNSSNGTIYKGERVNKVVLGHYDEFVIGGVTFTVKIRSEFLKDESATLMAVDENQTVDIEEIIEVQTEDGEHLDAFGDIVEDGPQEKSIIKRIWKDEAKRKKFIIGLVVVMGLYVVLDEEEKPAPKKATSKVAKVAKPINVSQKVLTEEQRRSFSALYEIGKDHYNNGRYREALIELQKIAAVDINFNSNLQALISFSKEGLKKIEEEEKKRQADLAAAERKIKVTKYLEEAREYTKDRRVELANKTFNEITQLDPENLEVIRMKMELEDWLKEKQRKDLEEAQKKKEREDKVDKLKLSRTLYLQKEWFKAIGRLEEFLNIKIMDDDLTTEATDMLKVSRDELNSAVAPLIGKAKSLLEGQDLKGAYEVYQQILRIEPSNAESLNQIGDIRDQLSNRARKIYREAIISESLSLFQDAKEKFQEVQQISPVDSVYYKKASEKLRDYLE